MKSPICMCDEGDRSKTFRRQRILPTAVIVVSRVEFVASEESPAYENRQKLDYETMEGFLIAVAFLKTTYEMLIEDMDLEIRWVGEFLGEGKPDHSTSPRLRHQNLEPLSQLISKFDRLRSISPNSVEQTS